MGAAFSKGIICVERVPQDGTSGRPIFPILALTAILCLAHCSSDDNGGGNPPTPETPCVPETELIDASMTVGYCAAAGNPTWGYWDSPLCTPSQIGSIMGDTILTIGGRDYSIETLYRRTNGVTHLLFLDFDDNESLPNENLILQLGSDEFVLDDADPSAGYG